MQIMHFKFCSVSVSDRERATRRGGKRERGGMERERGGEKQGKIKREVERKGVRKGERAYVWRNG